jgi:uncharacterized protein YjgD (DUF1641 family)
MARPITLEVPPRDPQMELLTRLKEAPAEHAAALLAVYDVLQGLHDRGVLDLMSGALGSGDKILELLVTSAQSPQSVRGIRNLVLIVHALGAIDPEVLRSFVGIIPEAFEIMVRNPEPPGLWRLLQDFLWNADFRHGMAGVNTLLEVIGRHLTDGQGSNGEAKKPGT